MEKYTFRLFLTTQTHPASCTKHMRCCECYELSKPFCNPSDTFAGSWKDTKHLQTPFHHISGGQMDARRPASHMRQLCTCVAACLHAKFVDPLYVIRASWSTSMRAALSMATFVTKAATLVIGAIVCSSQTFRIVNYSQSSQGFC